MIRRHRTRSLPNEQGSKNGTRPGSILPPGRVPAQAARYAALTVASALVPGPPAGSGAGASR
jgi:hypothetical protein